jgi:hypothetical protein
MRTARIGDMRYAGIALPFLALALSSPVQAQSTPPAGSSSDSARKYLLEQVDDAAVVQLYADGFASLPLREKTLIWHLTRAALACF